jgi:hypothetical protein
MVENRLLTDVLTEQPGAGKFPVIELPGLTPSYIAVEQPGNMRLPENFNENVVTGEPIICPEKIQPFTVGKLYPLVESIINSAILLTYPAIDLPVVLFQDVNRCVGRAPIYDNQFDPAILLTQDAENASLEIRTGVVGCRYHRNQW